MRIAVLGATGRTGRLLVGQALARGHQVTALARDPARLADLAADGLRPVRADVTEPSTVLTAIEGADVVVSALGLARNQDPRVLTDGAALVAGAGPRLVWLGSLGLGATRGALGPLNGALLKRMLRHEWEAKAVADRTVQDSGGTLVHAGPLTNRPQPGAGVLVPAQDFTPRLIPPTAPRPDLAALLLTEAEHPRFPAATAIALSNRRP